MQKIFAKYRQEINYSQIQKEVNNLIEKARAIESNEVKKELFSFIDLTFLSVKDSYKSIRRVVEKVNQVKHKFDIDNVAGVCVYPRFVKTVRTNLTDKDVRVVSVAAGFPASQTFAEVKRLETELAVRYGADEVDIVISVGEFFEENYELVYNEVKELKQIAGDRIIKVILETGTLNDFTLIYKASILAMEGGADFIKTSTGKEKIGATPEAGYVMVMAIKDFYKESGKQVGFKPAGGVSNSATALIYYTIVKEVLGEQWLRSNLFRIGSSGLANNLLKELGYVEKEFFFFFCRGILV